MKKFLWALSIIPSIAVFVCIPAFWQFRNITKGSLVPIIGIIVMLWQYFIYRGDDPSETGFYVASPYANSKREEQLEVMHRLAKIIIRCVPLQIIFLIYFSDLGKAIGAAFVVILPFIFNSVIAIIEYKK